ncbi:MAG: MBL fold metallo-hydrolase [Thermoleophilia bacterium]
MKIKWLGHSCFLVTAASGASLLTDPYDSRNYPGRLLYTPLEETPGLAPDVVTVSHGHADHGNVEAVQGSPRVLREATEQVEAAGFSIRGLPMFHDSQEGSKRGSDVVFIIGTDGLSICHLGDLGHELSEEQAKAIGSIDVLLIPVGGFFTIDAAAATRIWERLAPPVTLPMHYRNDKCLFEIEGVGKFLEGKAGVEHPGTSEIGLEKENLPAGPKIVVLEHAN